MYTIRISSNFKEVGTSSQIRSFLQPFEYRGLNSFTNIGKYKEMPFAVEFPIFDMMPSAKRSDLLNNTPLGSQFLVLSEKAFGILSQSLNIDEYQYFTIKILHKKEIIEYKALHFLQNRRGEFTDWSNSTFTLYGDWVGDNARRPELETLKFKNDDEYLNRMRNPIPVETVVHEKNVQLVENILFDLFYYPFTFNGGYLCSEKFKEVVEKNKLTGFQFIPF